MLFCALNSELQAAVNTLLCWCTLDTKSTAASVMWLNKKMFMHHETFSSDDHDNDKEGNYGDARQNAIYSSLVNFLMSLTLIKHFSVELLSELLFS